MKDKLTIAGATQKALLSISKPASIGDIYTEILRQQLYQFNTPTPEHVLRTTIRRYTGNIERIDSSEVVLFEMVEDEIYALSAEARPAIKNRVATSMKRIHRASDKEEIIKLLMADQVGIFKEIWRLLLFAAQVGVKNGKREVLRSVDSGKGIDQSTFGNCPSWPGIIYLMALTESGSSDTLAGSPEAEDTRIALFQEYANGGLSILREFFSDRLVDLDGMLAFVESQSTEKAKAPNLDLTI
jgi:dnd system-associated protein 4